MFKKALRNFDLVIQIGMDLVEFWERKREKKHKMMGQKTNKQTETLQWDKVKNEANVFLSMGRSFCYLQIQSARFENENFRNKNKTK